MNETIEHMRAGRLDEAHAIVQGDPSPEAAYLHGIVHRREEDFSNARYWFSRARVVGDRMGLDPERLTQLAQRAERDHEGERAELDALERVLGEKVLGEKVLGEAP